MQKSRFCICTQLYLYAIESYWDVPVPCLVFFKDIFTNLFDLQTSQAIALLDQLDKDINTFAMRVREWYSYHFPELVKIVPDNYTYARVACFLKSRKDFDSTKVEPLEEIVMDSAKAQVTIWGDASVGKSGL